MCGIAGLLDLERRSGSQELEALGRAALRGGVGEARVREAIVAAAQ